MVHAYDMNMGVPDTPHSPHEPESELSGYTQEKRPEILVTGSNLPIHQYRGTKRRREAMHWTSGAHKRRRSRCSLSEEPVSRPASRNTTSLPKSASAFGPLDHKLVHSADPQQCDSDSSNSPLFASERSVVPGLRHTNLREVLQYVINDALKIGGRPDSAVARETEFGEIIEIQTRSPNGQTCYKDIEWLVDADVPETMLSE
jgi:hypothetical protein